MSFMVAIVFLFFLSLRPSNPPEFLVARVYLIKPQISGETCAGNLITGSRDSQIVVCDQGVIKLIHLEFRV